jgi:hypothetical protein
MELLFIIGNFFLAVIAGWLLVSIFMIIKDEICEKWDK